MATRSDDEEVRSQSSSIAKAIIVGAVIIALSNLVGSGVIKPKGAATAAVAPAAPTAQAPAPAAPEAPTGPVTVSLDDDPVLGNKNAPVTLVEFSDYECPFCKRHFDDTYQQLKKNYIDTGKVKLVYRDLPLSFHDPMATKEAVAANCAREQGGDPSYYKFHDEMFKKTTSNGNGLDDTKVKAIASELGLNTASFNTCYDAQESKDEVAKDLADASKAGASGTPSFFIGKSGTGDSIEGTIIVGAQPYATFQTQIDALLQ